MPRKIRIIIPGVPHHIVHRGSRKDPIFFDARDREFYKELLLLYCDRYGVRISNYCLMTNHVHLIAIPEDELALSKAIGITHKVFSGYINQKRNLSGHLWEGRFHSYPMSELHFIQAARYVERNPVAAGIVQKPQEYPWSSCLHWMGKKTDFLIKYHHLSELIDHWSIFVQKPCKKEIESEISFHLNKGILTRDDLQKRPRDYPGKVPG